MTRTRRLTLALAILLPPLFLLAALIYLLSDSGLNTTVRPHLERYLGERMEAEVRLEHIALDRRRLEISGILVDAPGRYRLVAQRLEAGFSLSELLARRLALLRLVEPHVEIAESDEEGGGLPERPPLTIERIEVVQGRLTLHAAGRSWLMEEIRLRGRLDEVSPIDLVALVGDSPGIPLEMRGRLSWEREPSLVIESGRLEGEELLTSPLTVTFPEEGAGAAGAIGIERFDDAQLDRILTVFGIASPLPPEGRFTLEGLRLAFSWQDELLKMGLTAQSFRGGAGEFDLFARELRLHGERTGGAWEGEGDLLLAGSAPLRLSGRMAGGEAKGIFALSAADPAALLEQIVGGEWPRVSGGIDGHGEISASAGRLRVEAFLVGTPAPEKQSDLPDISGLSAEVSIDRAGEAYSGGVMLLRQERKIARAEGNLHELKVELYSMDGGELAELLPASMRGQVPQGTEKIAASAVLLPGEEGWSGSVDMKADRIPFSQALLEEVRLEGRFTQEGEKTTFRQGVFSARLSGDDIPAARLSGTGSGEVEGERFRIVFNRVAAEEVEFISADGMAGISGAAVHGWGEAERLRGAVYLNLWADVNAGEVLRGAFYADFSALPAAVRLQGRYDPELQRLGAQRLILILPEIGKAELQGSVDAVNIDLTGVLELPDLKRSAERLEILGESFPILAQTAPAGSLGIEANFLRDDSGWRLRGSAQPSRLDLQMESAQFHLNDLSGTLPFDLGTTPGTGGERASTLTVARLAYKGAEFRGGELRLRSAPGRFTFPDPLVFGIAGGELEIAEAQVDFSEENPGFSADLRVRGVELGELTRELETIEMKGLLSADLGRIEYKGGALTTEGEMKIDAFGGHFRIRNLRLESLFTPYMVSSLDVDFTGVDLRLLTATFAFGEVNGIADGYIHELRLFGAVPSHFDASFETRTRGRRNISVRALRNLTTISQGGLSAVLSRGIYRFIDFYRYRKIGLHCTLQNDVFVLTGTAREGDERYLVDGGLWPPKINIIAPEHAISFKEMINRLQRIDRTAGGN